MKKIIALLLAAVLLLALSACGQVKLPDIPSTQALQSSRESAEGSTEANTPETQALPETEAPTTEPEETEAPVEFEEVTVADTEACSIKITGVKMDPIWGYTLKVLLENKSETTTYMCSVSSASVNGVSWDPFFATEVAPGKKKNDEINFFDDEKEALLSPFTDIALEFRVYDADDWASEDVLVESVHIYPLGEDKVQLYVREPQPEDIVLAEDDNFSMTVTGTEIDPLWGYTLKVYLVNKTQTPLTFSVDDVSVNGFMCDPFWATTVAPGTADFAKISWSDESFEENGIEEVEDIEMKLRVYNADDYSADNLYEDVISLNP